MVLYSNKYLLHVDECLVGELLKMVLYSNNKFETESWVSLRQCALVSIVETRPLPAAAFLVPAFYDKNNCLEAKFALLDSLTKAGIALGGGDSQEGRAATSVVAKHKDYGE